MFDQLNGDAACRALSELVGALATLDQSVEDEVRVDRIRLLEELKSAVAAAQIRETAAFAASQRATQLEAGAPAARATRGIAAQVGLARRMSPFRAQREAGWARILTAELPNTFAALQAGQTSEWRAMIIARETAWLSADHRAQVDRELAAGLPEYGDRRVEAETKKLAYRLDPYGYVNRVRGAAADRRVTMRPAPDAMVRLTALTPVAQGVACFAELTRTADALRAAGDPRTRGQVMADTVVERILGQAHAGDVSVEVNLVMTDQTLLDAGPGRDEPATLLGYGPIPAPVARDLAVNYRGGPERADEQQQREGLRWLRRLYADPVSGRLVAMDSARRLFTEGQQRFLAARDQTCRTPWCDAPIRHYDHVRSAEQGGPTSIGNGQGLCAACNYAKQAPGWHSRPSPDGSGDHVDITTPTGHRYRSRPPAPPDSRRSRPLVLIHDRMAPLERRVAELLNVTAAVA